MPYRVIARLIGVFLGLLASSALAALSDFAGDWTNVNSSTRSLTRLHLAVSGANVTVRAWGKCHPQDCDWGTEPGVPYSPAVGSPPAAAAIAVSTEFTTGFSRSILILRAARGGRLTAQLFTRFTDQSGRSNYSVTERFTRAGAPAAGGAGRRREDCIAFDYRRAQVANVGGRWKIVVGNMWLKDFGGNRNEANRALRVLNHYRMNKQCFVGRPDPSLEYYLTDNRSPTGSLQGEDCVGFNPARIQVSRINGRWKIVEGSHWILDFGSKEGEAREAFRILRHYRFTHSCFVGRPGPSMTYFRR